jgi:hypothetical protein
VGAEKKISLKDAGNNIRFYTVDSKNLRVLGVLCVKL